MDKTTYRALTTEERISFLNSEMAAGKKLNLVCKEIGIADNISTEFRKKGYTRDEQGLYIKHDQQHPGQMNIDHLKTDEVTQGDTESEEGTNTPPVVNETTGSKISLSENDLPKSGEPKRVGRPPRTGKKMKKLTIEIDPDVYKALLFYKIDQELYMNNYIEELIKANVPEKYFDI
ncbi:MAG TPA: hypothetical protein VFC84_01965 [Desulfosporosinus sp.]|nr:hypothetical protein [Desulfosporosinus sp.]